MKNRLQLIDILYRLAITFSDHVGKGSRNSSPKKKTAAKAKRLNTAAFTVIEKRSRFYAVEFSGPDVLSCKAAKSTRKVKYCLSNDHYLFCLQPHKLSVCLISKAIYKYPIKQSVPTRWHIAVRWWETDPEALLEQFHIKEISPPSWYQKVTDGGRWYRKELYTWRFPELLRLPVPHLQCPNQINNK